MKSKEIKKLVIECLKRENPSGGWWHMDEIEEYVKNNAQEIIPKKLLEPSINTKKAENFAVLRKSIWNTLSAEKRNNRVQNKKNQGLWKIKIQKPSIFGNDGEDG